MRKVILLSILFSGLLLSNSFRVSGQVNSTLHVEFLDSLKAEEGSYLIYGLISLKNLAETSSNLQLSLSAPVGWRLMGEPILRLTALPNSIQKVPITLLRERIASANWTPFSIHLADKDGNLILDTFLLIKAPMIHDFSVIALQSKFELELGETFLKVPLQLYNKGTTEGVYSFAVRNSQVDMEKFSSVRVGVGKDTSIVLTVKLPSSLLKKEEQILLQISDTVGNSRSIPVSYYSVYRNLKVNPSRYKTIPLSLELGSFLVDKQFYHYLDANTSFNLKHGVLDLSFRTKTFGPLRTVERNILIANFRTRQLDLSIGQLSQIKHFYAYGRGVKVVVKGKKGNLFGIDGIVPIRNSVQTNNNFSTYLQYSSGKMTWWHQLALDVDKRRGLNGYLVFNEMSYKISRDSYFKINVSAGWEEFTRISVFSNNDLGIGLGYNYQGQFKNWDWQSNWQYHQKSYPGVNKGARTIFQMLRWKIRKNSFDLSYQYNSTTSSILQDTLYIADAFYFNMEKLGVKWAWGSEKVTFSLGSGLFRQTGLSAGQLPRYQFLELAFSAKTSAKSKISLTSFTGYANNSLVDQPVWLTNSTLDIQFNRVGLRGFYVQQPLLRDSILKYLIRYNQTLLFSPYVNFRFFHRLSGSFRYSISKSLYDNRTNTSIGFNMFFRTRKDDWQITATGAIPLTRSLAPGATGFSFPYLTFSVKKRLQLPAIHKRRYHDLKVVAFEDLNLNGIPDAADRTMADYRISIDNRQFITDKNGSILLSNTDTGVYNITVQSLGSNRSLIPMERSKLVSLQRSKEVLLPFRKGHVVFGKVYLDLDRYSGIKFTPDNILIRVLNDQGKEFTVLTDSVGNFSLPLPTGNYTVSLNPDAFKGAIRPEQLSFSIDLITSNEQEVNFKLIQRRREIRMRQL